MYHSDDDRRPREVEIIPPGEDERPPRDGREVWVGRHRVYIVKPGPFGVILGLLGLGALAAIGFIAFLGLFILWLPLVGVFALAAILSAFLRGPRRF
jgi:hypothetical protein